MKKVNLFLSSRRILAMAALASGVALSPQTVMASQVAQSVQQTGTVKGQIVDASGEPVIGATVRVKGSKEGTITDLGGNFTLKAEAGAILEVSYIGFKPLTAKATNAPMKLTLVDDNQALNEVVVVGFGTQKKVNLTGSVAVVDSKEFEARPVTSATQALQGAVPGLRISSSSGSLESTQSMSVRGIGTIGEGSSGSPLVLIDGSEGDINTINPQDIESVSVLKDAAASSIYGSRAPFGVILITTKSGKKGKVTVNYNNSFRFNSLIREKHMMNSVDFASWMNDFSTAEGGGAFFTDERMAQIKAYHEATPIGPGTRQDKNGNKLYAIGSSNGSTWDDGYGYGIDDVDWYGVVYRNTSFAQEHNASVSGATDVVNYYASFNFLDNQGFMKLADDKYSRYTGTAKLGIQITKWLKMNYNMRYTRTDYKRPANLTSGLYSDMARQGWPILPLYDRNGYYYDSPSPALGLSTRGKDTKQRDIMNHKVGFVLEPIKNWITHIDFNYQTDSFNRHWDAKMTYNHDVNGNPIPYNTSSNVHEEYSKENYLNFQAYSEYSLNLAEKHNFKIMAGFQAEQLKQTVFGLQRNGILDPDKPEVDNTSGVGYDGKAVTPSTNGARNQWQTAGFFGRLNYNYMERYLAEVNLRYDGTSKYRRNQMWKTFPSFSLGWNIARENFWKPLEKTVNTLKLRFSYGTLGNQNLNNWYHTYQTISYTPFGGTWLQDGKMTNVTSAPGLVSTTLTWEKVESYNYGLDWGLFNNRLTGSFDYYIRNTKNMVGNAPELPAILGTGVPKTNNTDLKTNGWEISLSWKDMLENGLAYNISLNLSDARTKITRYPNNPTNSIDTYIPGRYINEIWGYETVGIAKSQEEMDKHLATADQSKFGSSWGAGDIMYKDLNGDNVVNDGARTLADHGDLKVIGNSTPRYLFGIDLGASWKGFDFRAFLQGVMKRDYFTNSAYMFGCNGNIWWSTGLTGVQDYYRDANTWSVKNGYQSENTNAYLPRPVQNGKNSQYQTKYLLNAAYMRMKNLQVGYTIPQELTSKWGIANCRVFFSVENLFTITSMPDQFDPETIGTDSDNGYPLSRTVSFGLNITL